MLKELIRKLGEPCAQQCVGEEGVNGKECHGACEQRKMAKMKRFLATVTKRAKTQRTLRQVKEGTTSPPKKAWLIAKTLSMMPRAEARADDAARKKEAAAFFAAKFAKNKPSSRFPKVSRYL
jgi:TorA maturation chaperone TorD